MWKPIRKEVHRSPFWTIALVTGHVPLHVHNRQIINSPLASIYTSLPVPIVSFQYNNFYWNDARTCLLLTLNGPDLFCGSDCVATYTNDFRSIQGSDVQKYLDDKEFYDISQLRIIVHWSVRLLTIYFFFLCQETVFVITCNRNGIFISF